MSETDPESWRKVPLFGLMRDLVSDAMDTVGMESLTSVTDTLAVALRPSLA